MIFLRNKPFICWPVVFLALSLALTSCSNKSSNPQGTFDIYGRVVYRPLIAGSSAAEFYLFHYGRAVTDGLITVAGDTIPLVDAAAGYYRSDFPIQIGDTLSYSVDSQYGTAGGEVVIPDTVSIIAPREFDTLFTGTSFPASWHRGPNADGYYAYLEDENGNVAAITEAQIDTTAVISGENLINIGVNRFWVEALSGSFNPVIAPDGRELPEGIVGSAGNYKEVYVTLPARSRVTHEM